MILLFGMMQALAKSTKSGTCNTTDKQKKKTKQIKKKTNKKKKTKKESKKRKEKKKKQEKERRKERKGPETLDKHGV